MEPLAELEVGDSKFLGFCFAIQNLKEASEHRAKLQSQYPKAAHVPVIWRLSRGPESSHGFDEDGEPPNSVGPGILRLIQEQQQQQSPTGGVAVVIVRYFESQLLGVTCGRLPQCYEGIARLSLHRFFTNSGTPLEWNIPTIHDHNIYGMAAGDSELILNIVEENNGNNASMMEQIEQELNFGGFRGAQGELLPRLQNLQADLTQHLVPMYRYPGNYTGQEWQTFEWGPASLQIKKSVEQALLPLVSQTMNHCVTNYYRDGSDFIAHHSDKVLDLTHTGVIVSVSLGDERILELRRRKEPHDITRVALPHGSMLVLGPKTNQQFTHSILPKEGSTKVRISLTLRECLTFLDLKTGRLFGQGSEAKTLQEVQTQHWRDCMTWYGGLSCCVFSSMKLWSLSKTNKSEQSSANKSLLESPVALASLLGVGFLAMGRYHWNRLSYQKREEQAARDSFSKASLSGTKY